MWLGKPNLIHLFLLFLRLLVKQQTAAEPVLAGVDRAAEPAGWQLRNKMPTGQ